MAQLQRIDLDFSKAETEFVEFRKFLQDNATFSERDVVAQLKKRQHLSCLIGSMPAGVKRADVYKFEFQIQGVFRADLVVGNLQRKTFVFVEFEPGQDTSLFGRHQTTRCETGHGSLSMVLANSLIGGGRYKIRATPP